ncbi:MAG: stage II sporulation protein R [Oscillospiraceae bacterium]|nr:stage II sporulation protein R [Oscillospiraceae bacterium]
MMNKLEISLLAGFIASVLFAGVCSFADSYGNITGNVFRLHILANSDSNEDQELKLKLRDEILKETAWIFKDSGSSAAAAVKAKENLAEIENIAREALAESGYNYDVSCEVKDVYFPARVYGDITLPAGVYSALSVNIGEAKGQNWWCVMFPPLCIPAVTEKEIMIEDKDILCGTFNTQEMQLLENPEKYEVKFYFAEMYHKLSGKDKIS